MNIVAGHVGVAEISGDPHFHDIYFDGKSHYYIDGTVLDSGTIPVIFLDTDTSKFYRVTETGRYMILPMMKKIKNRKLQYQVEHVLCQNQSLLCDKSRF